MKTKITIKEALEQGHEYFFVQGSHSEHVHTIRDEAKDYLNDGDVLFLAKESDHMVLDAYSIFENACDDLHEGALDNVYNSEEYKLFEKVCKEVTLALKDATQSYVVTDIQIIENHLLTETKQEKSEEV